MEESILDSIGSELIEIISPVSICMFLVVLLVSTLFPPSSSSAQFVSVADIVYAENPTDSIAAKLTGAVENAVVFILFIAAATFLIAILYYYNFTNFLKYYMRFSVFFILLTTGGAIIFSILRHFEIVVDVVSFAVFMLNFAGVGVVAVSGGGVPIVVKQGYTVVLGVISAVLFTQLPEWTTWAVLVGLAVYDLVAVLVPGGPLKILVELAQSRDENLPAFVLLYETRPRVIRVSRGGGVEMRSLGGNDGTRGEVDGDRVGLVSNLESSSEIGVVVDEEMPRVRVRGSRGEGEIGGLGDNVGIEMQGLGGNDGNVGDREEERVGLLSNLGSSSEIGVAVDEEMPRVRVRGSRGEGEIGGLGDNVGIEMQSVGGNDGNVSDRGEERVGLESNLGSSSEIGVADEERSRLVEGRGGVEEDDSKMIIQGGGLLGLGDFVFYSVLVGRAAMYDLMTVYACYLAIISGLACTITMSFMSHRALPALPISIALGVAFYFLTRLLMEPFVVQVSTNLLMF